MPVAIAAQPWLPCAWKVVWGELRLGKERDVTYPCAQAGRERAEAERAGGRKGTVVAYGGGGGEPSRRQRGNFERGRALGRKKGPTSVLQSKK